MLTLSNLPQTGLVRYIKYEMIIVMKPIKRWPLVVLAILAFTPIAHGDFVVIISQALSVGNAGITYEGYEGPGEGYIPTTINGNDIATPSTIWTVNFLTPFSEVVPSERGRYLLFRTEPDATPEDGPETDFLIEGVNFEMVAGAIPAGVGPAQISFNDLPMLGTPEAVAGDYTLFVFELPETKWVYDPETDASTQMAYTDEDFLTWFKWSYGVDYDLYTGDVPITYDPVNQKHFTFTYIAADEPECCSSVLFIPGFKGSVLSNNGDTLWPPTVFSNDVPQLALDGAGVSFNEIQVEGLVNTFYGTDIYGTFSSFLDEFVTEGVVSDWLPLAYDWRIMPEQILDEGISTADGVVDVIETIEELAAESKTGKVTIVTHSMGGLMGKAIIKRLDEAGKGHLIETFVLAGSPQLGTPQAVASMLHGDDEGILGGYIVAPSAARSLSLSMPSAYSLLPSSEYFQKVTDPVILFNENADFTDDWRAQWGNSISTYSAYAEFLTGQGVTRPNPPDDALRIPEIGRENILSGAQSLHDIYDQYEFPTHIRVVQIAGWGLPTVEAVRYRERHWTQSYETHFTREGDGTVVYPSAIAVDTDETYYFDIFQHNKALGDEIRHRDLLSAESVMAIVKSAVQGEAVDPEIQYISISKPQSVSLDDAIIVSSHSPVVLGAYDHLGNFTGIDPHQDSATGVLMVSEEIPGSMFVYSSESQYIFLPKNGTYRFVYKGTGSGPTTVSVDTMTGDATLPVAQYSDIPTNIETSASFILDAETLADVAIALDTDGDGEVDATVMPDTEVQSLEGLLLRIREDIAALSVAEKPRKNLNKRVDALERKIEAKKLANTKVLQKFRETIALKEARGRIASADAAAIMDLLVILESQAGTVALDVEVLSVLRSKILSLSIKDSAKSTLLKRVAKLENKERLIHTLANFTDDIVRKVTKGKLTSTDAERLIAILKNIEEVL